VRATKKGGTKRLSAKRAKRTSTKARVGQQTGTRTAEAVVAPAVTTGREALVGAPRGAVTGAVHGAKTAVAPEPSPAGTAGPERSDEEEGGEPGC
jgi:hypothetical protein